jgi:hypothetical protein
MSRGRKHHKYSRVSALQRTRLEFDAGSNQIRSNRVSEAFPAGSTLTFPPLCRMGSLTTTGSTGNSPTTRQTYSLRTTCGLSGSLTEVFSVSSGGWNRWRIAGSATLAKITTPEVTASSRLMARLERRSLGQYSSGLLYPRQDIACLPCI